MRSTGSLRLVRGVACALAAVVAAGLLTGCGVPADASAGVSVDANGRPVGLLAVCGNHIDGATLYRPDSDADISVEGRWTADDRVAPGVVRWPMEGDAPGWTVDHHLAGLRPGVPYTLSGWTLDNSWSAVAVDFTLADLAGLTPGRVRFLDVHKGDGGEEATVDAADFRERACG
jgi:hypothetical protein